MIMNTADLIQCVRDQVAEHDAAPLTDEAILRRLNFGYSYIYNHMIKSNDSMFTKFDYLDVTPGRVQYPLPKYLHGKRIEQIEYAMPPQNSFAPVVYNRLMKVDPQSFFQADLPQIRILVQQLWTQIGNDIWFAPPPSTASKFRLLITPTLVPLGLLQGKITDITGSTITIDRGIRTDMVDALGITNQNFFTVSCGMTGRVKGIFGYESADNTTITLGRCSSRTTVNMEPITQVTTLDIGLMTYDPLTQVITAEVLSGNGTSFNAGDKIEILQTLTVGTSVNIDEALTDDSDFYARPEYTVPQLPLTRGGTVINSSSFAISWLDSSYTPQFVNGYRGATGIARTGTFNACANYTHEGQPTVKLTTVSAHGLTLNEVWKINVAGTNTNCDVAGLKVIPISATELVALVNGLVGVYSGAGTFTEYQFTNITTGTPRYKSCTYGTPTLPSTEVYRNSPYTLANGVFDVTSRDPSVYKQENNIEIDDLITLGYTTGAPIVPESMMEILVHWAVLTLKSSLNESDTEVAAFLKENLKELAGDNSGRNLSIYLEKSSAPMGRRYDRRGRR